MGAPTWADPAGPFQGPALQRDSAEALQYGWLREAKSSAPSHTACSSVAVRRLALVCGSSLLLGQEGTMRAIFQRGG